VSLSYALGVLVVILVLIRQTRVRPVQRFFRPRLPVFLGVLGLFELLDYTGAHHLAGGASLWLAGTLLGGAVVLGAVRALSVRVWTSSRWVVRQGTTITMVLWVLSLGVHFVGEGGSARAGGATLQGASFLLHLGLTLGVQGYVLYRRALPLWDELGPEAGRRLQVNFGQGPNAFFGTIFTNFGDGGPAGPGRPAGRPDVIDAEVVEDDEEPPELPRPR